MPIYEYVCDDCGKQREVIQKITDQPLRTCPDCGGKVHKLISQTSFVLKGNGWYVTDYASPERKKAQEADAPVCSKKQEKTDIRTEGKAETKAESHAGTVSKS
jgi:putative FmdB family regulatory protein